MGTGSPSELFSTGQSDYYDVIVSFPLLSARASMFFLYLTLWFIADTLRIIPLIAQSVHRRPSFHQSKILIFIRKYTEN
jgi:hypothetical protein